MKTLNELKTENDALHMVHHLYIEKYAVARNHAEKRMKLYINEILGWEKPEYDVTITDIHITIIIPFETDKNGNNKHRIRLHREFDVFNPLNTTPITHADYDSPIKKPTEKNRYVKFLDAVAKINHAILTKHTSLHRLNEEWVLLGMNNTTIRELDLMLKSSVAAVDFVSKLMGVLTLADSEVSKHFNDNTAITTDKLNDILHGWKKTDLNKAWPGIVTRTLPDNVNIEKIVNEYEKHVNPYKK